MRGIADVNTFSCFFKEKRNNKENQNYQSETREMSPPHHPRSKAIDFISTTFCLQLVHIIVLATIQFIFSYVVRRATFALVLNGVHSSVMLFPGQINPLTQSTFSIEIPHNPHNPNPPMNPHFLS